MSLPRLLLLLSVSLFLPLGIASAQPRSGGAQATRPSAFQGTALDPSGAPIAGAKVSSVLEDQSAGPSTTTDQRGEFSLTLPPGRHTVIVASPGFLDQAQAITIPQTSVAPAEFLLQLASLHEDVTVSASGGYLAPDITSATKTSALLRDIPQSVTVVTQELMRDQAMTSIGDVMRYVPGVSVHQGENNRDQVIMRGNSSSADFFVDGVRDDVQYYRDLYNLSRIEVLKGPNALIFGRGGAGGVVNRIGKEAVFQPFHEASFQLGMYGNKRFTTDLNQPAGRAAAFRLNAMLEDSDSFRDHVGLIRYGVTPTVTFSPGNATKIVASYEYLNDTRVADRGITSFQGRPAAVNPSTYYGNPDDSHVDAAVNLGYITVEHQKGAVKVRNHTSLAVYDRSYQNFVPGAVDATQTNVTLTAYNNATERTNLFNQTDLSYVAKTGVVRHSLLVGVEIGRQLTDNVRNTGFFNNTSTSIAAPFGSPTISTPMTFRQNATDADNHLRTMLAAAYTQDLIDLGSHLQVVGGLRFDRFDLQYHNNRNGDTLERPDNLVSPRAGVVVKPIVPLSIYASYSVSHLPSSGDQFSSLTTVTQQVQPERFDNYEVGMKWDVVPTLALNMAAYRLDRTNTRSTDPNDPTRIVQTGSQRANGYELGLNGNITPAWGIAGGYSYQDVFVTSATTAAATGAVPGQIPHHTLSLWNNYRVHPRVSAGLGLIHRSEMFAAIDDTVALPGYTRVDLGVFVPLTSAARLQINVENLFNTRYFLNADSNTNISPGSPHAVRVGLTARF